MPVQKSLMIARFPGGGVENADTTDWYVRTVLEAKEDPRIRAVIPWKKSDTPITMTRNQCLKDALDMNVDYVLMIDSDMKPDQGDKPFFKTAFDFLYSHHVPAIVGAPYVGPPPHENVYVFRWRSLNNDNPETANFRLDQYSREEAAGLKGIQPCAALPTGLMLMDMRVLDRCPPKQAVVLDAEGRPWMKPGSKMPLGWFYYEWTDEYARFKMSTEDVTFTRDVSIGWHDVEGAGCFCAWDCWAEHIKTKYCGKPKMLTHRDVGGAFHSALVRKGDVPADSGRPEEVGAVDTVVPGSNRVEQCGVGAADGSQPSAGGSVGL